MDKIPGPVFDFRQIAAAELLPLDPGTAPRILYVKKSCPRRKSKLITVLQGVHSSVVWYSSRV
jgi:hypothetical protein